MIFTALAARCRRGGRAAPNIRRPVYSTGLSSVVLLGAGGLDWVRRLEGEEKMSLFSSRDPRVPELESRIKEIEWRYKRLEKLVLDLNECNSKAITTTMDKVVNLCDTLKRNPVRV